MSLRRASGTGKSKVTKEPSRRVGAVTPRLWGLLGLPWVVWQVMLLVSAVLVGDSWLSQADG